MQIVSEFPSCDGGNPSISTAVFNHPITYAQVQTVCDALQGELPRAKSREEYQGKVYDRVSTAFYQQLEESGIARFII